MESQNDKKQFIDNEGESIDNIVFVPYENIRAIENVILNWEAVKNLWKQTRPHSPYGGEFKMND